LEDFKNNFKVEIKELDDEHIVFDMIGVSAPIANAFRRILIAEVPTMAIDHVRSFELT
jgi:DNA-directed RNA polymerase I and III subunit RPAC1